MWTVHDSAHAFYWNDRRNEAAATKHLNVSFKPCKE